MAIPESQLETWSHQGSIAQSSATYQTIKNALESSAAKYAGRDFDVFLQGSYHNDTNIYAESDVDVIVRLNSCYFADLNQLTDAQRQAYNASGVTNAAYPFSQFETEVIQQLTKAFGNDAKPDSKAVKIAASGNRRSADVIIAAEHRRYTKFNSANDWSYWQGISFFTKDGTRIDNFPKYHSENATAKHKATQSWYKPTARIYKNIRRSLVADGRIDAKCAPSYYIEGLLYNAPNELFGSSYQDTVGHTLAWLLNADRSKFVCVNERYYLLHDTSAVCWRSGKCEQFLKAALHLWNNWHDL